jgi:hypothetical protein
MTATLHSIVVVTLENPDYRGATLLIALTGEASAGAVVVAVAH